MMQGHMNGKFPNMLLSLYLLVHLLSGPCVMSSQLFNKTIME